MPQSKLFDLALGLDSPCWAVLHLLSEVEFPVHSELLIPRTTAIYNGRTNAGFTLTLTGSQRTLYLCVFQHSVSDDLYVVSWISSPFQDYPPLTTDEIPRKAWENARILGFGEFNKVTKAVKEALHEFLPEVEEFGRY